MIQTTFDVPALFAKSASPSVTDRYNFISSENVMDVLGEHGWSPRAAFYRKPRTDMDPLYKRHCVRFQESVYDGDPRGMRRKVWPEIIMYNAHDGTSSLTLEAGIFRLVCSNGMTVKDQDFGTMRIRHDNPYLQFDSYIPTKLHLFGSRVYKVMDKVDQWDTVEVDHGDRFEFYRQALSLRDHELDHVFSFDAHTRPEDAGQSLWKVFNRTQERIVNGGYNVPANTRKGYRKARAISAVDRLQTINSDLWELGEELYAKVVA